MNEKIQAKKHNYTEESIQSLDWREHIRARPGMYIGKMGDGGSPDDGIYVLLKEVMDNSIDEHLMGYGRRIDLALDEKEGTFSVRDFGRGIPLGKLMDCVARINTGGKYDDTAFQKSVGLNGVGIKAVNALSLSFTVQSFREGKTKRVSFSRGKVVEEGSVEPAQEKDGTRVVFQPDKTLFHHFFFLKDIVRDKIWHYAYLNTGLALYLNGEKYQSKHGLQDLLKHHMGEEETQYEPIFLKSEDVELCFTHRKGYKEDAYTFVNGQHTAQGGTHLNACKEALVKVSRHFYKKEFHSQDIRTGMVLALSLRMQEPVFESQTKTKLGSTHLRPEGPTMRSFFHQFLQQHLDDYLHKHPETANALLQKILSSERERKEIAGLRKLSQERQRRANVHNKKLRDCRLHFTDKKKPRHKESTLFITEGNSASGSITKSRDPQTQAVFSLRGKPLNCYGLSKKVVYEHEEFNLLQHALNIEDSTEHLRYNHIVIATDADVDGMHIRLLILTFFLQFFPELVEKHHVHILETPLFRVREKKKTTYCYTEQQRQNAIKDMPHAEITRFKGLGEISPNEFKLFIGKDMRLTPVNLNTYQALNETLAFYMGKNTAQRQNFILQHLRVEKDTF